MPTFAAAVAVCVYLIPVALYVAARARQSNPAPALAIGVPAVVAIDLLAILVLALLVPLELSAWIVRIAWCVLGLVRAWRSRRRGPEGVVGPVDRSWIVPALTAALLGVGLSMSVSSVYSVWDRVWHIGLTTSLRGQRIPFENVYLQSSGFHYHFSGDVLAAILQSFSADVIHSDHALSLAHDIMFGLTAACLALLLRAMGHGKPASAIFGALAVLLCGPVTLLRSEGGHLLHGYSLLNFFTMSFRPHVSLAGLLFTGFLGVVILRLREGGDVREASSSDGHIAALLAITSLMAITDEASTGLLGVALGTAWLVAPRVLDHRRRTGFLVLAAMLVSVIGVNQLFRASLSRGGPPHHFQWIDWRAPGYTNPPLSAGSEGAISLVLLDMFAALVAPLALLAVWRSSRSASVLTAFVFLMGLTVPSVLGLTRLNFNDTPLESHRFTTAALFAAPLFALAWLPQAPSGSLAKVGLLAVVLLPALSTLAWFRLASQHDFAPYKHAELGKIDCRTETNARFGEAPQARYVPKSLWYLWGGCRPTLTAGNAPSTLWAFPIENVVDGRPGLEGLAKTLRSEDEPAIAICPPSSAELAGDPICTYALAHAPCHPEGTKAVSCLLSRQDRAAILESR